MRDLVTTAGLFLGLRVLREFPAGIAVGVEWLHPLIGVAAAAILFGDRPGPLFGADVLLLLCGLAVLAAPASPANREQAPFETEGPLSDWTFRPFSVLDVVSVRFPRSVQKISVETKLMS